MEFIFVCTFVFDTVTRIVTYLIVVVVIVGKERVSNRIVLLMFY